ncbi:MAG: phosphodiesterase [Rhodospirillales bacterium]|nr:phosphodiesterase [Rhodospirillales bacterium]
MLIAQLTDLHLRPHGQSANRVVETNMLTARAVRAVAALRPAPDLVLLTGDLADRGEPGAYRLLAGMLADAGLPPVFAIPGNHDDRAALRAALPFVPQTGTFLHATVETFPVRLVLLDTLVPGSSHGELCAERLDWLDATLEAAPDRPTLIAMHHPPFATGIEHMDRIALRAPEAFAAMLARHRQVRLVVCGHVHRAITTRIGEAVACIAPSVAHQVTFDLGADAPSSFSMEPAAYLLHRWSPDGGWVTHTALVEAYPGPFPFLSAAQD